MSRNLLNLTAAAAIFLSGCATKKGGEGPLAPLPVYYDTPAVIIPPMRPDVNPPRIQTLMPRVEEYVHTCLQNSKNFQRSFLMKDDYAAALLSAYGIDKKRYKIDLRCLDISPTGQLSEELKKLNSLYQSMMQKIYPSKNENDMEIWRKVDYWANGMESIKKGKGDCEDRAIAMAELLIATGSAHPGQLFFGYVSGQNIENHLMLLVFPEPIDTWDLKKHDIRSLKPFMFDVNSANVSTVPFTGFAFPMNPEFIKDEKGIREPRFRTFDMKDGVMVGNSKHIRNVVPYLDYFIKHPGIKLQNF